MNKREALELLMQYLQQYGESGKFLFHRKFVEELQNILLKNASGKEKQVFSILVKQFGFIKAMGTAVNEADSNEVLKNTGTKRDFYSIHVQNKTVNVRMLMAFANQGNPIFLAAFYEKSGKKVSDYSQWIPVAEQRFQQMGV